MHGDRLLLGPGPSVPYPEAVEALTRPVLGHLDPEYLDVIAATADRLRTVFRTRNALTLPVSGTGSAGMEACLASLLEPGETVVVGVNGYFGERLCEVAHRGGAQVVRVEAPWGTPLDPADLLAAQRAHRDAAMVAVVAAETSTGVRNDVAPLGPELAGTDTLLLVDAVTALGGTRLEVDAWQIDACYSASQKCLGAPPGLAPVTLSPRAVERMRTRATPIRSFYLDLGLLQEYFLEKPAKYHHTASSTLACALHAGLGRLLAEGVEQVWERHARVGALLQSQLPELGFTLVAADGRLPQLTAALLPEGLADGPARTRLRGEFGIEVGGGLGALAGRAWRIGLMGHAATERSVVTLLGALRELMRA